MYDETDHIEHALALKYNTQHVHVYRSDKLMCHDCNLTTGV